jgi:hypothetical protein
VTEQTDKTIGADREKRVSGIVHEAGDGNDEDSSLVDSTLGKFGAQSLAFDDLAIVLVQTDEFIQRPYTDQT